MDHTSPTRAELRITNAISEMARVADFVNRFGVERGVEQDVINDLNLCLDELLNNTISYGYDDRDVHFICLQVYLQAGALVAEIKDDAMPFDPRTAPRPRLGGDIHQRRVGGLGLRFINTILDEVDYTRCENFNCVRLTRRLPPQPTGGTND
jgi:anti-sigma regulatory factor (Ser/Thr protein kinase)